MGGNAREYGRLLRDPRNGPGRTHYRLFCRLENGTVVELTERGLDRPQIVVINGLYKAHRTEFSDAEYKKNVRDLGDDYLARLPRPIASGG